MKRVSIKRDIYLHLFGLLLLLTAAYGLMVSQSYHIGINESTKYEFLYELKVAERHYLATGEAPHSDNVTFQIFLDPAQIPLKFQQAFAWQDFQDDEIYEAYINPSNNGDLNSSAGYGTYLYAAKHPLQDSDQIFYIVSEYDEALYFELLELSPPESSSHLNSALLMIGTLLLLVFLVVRLMVYRLTKPIMTLSTWSNTLDLDDVSQLKDFRYIEIQALAEQLVNSVEAERGANDRERFFLRAASHELRTPITTISASSDMLQRLTEQIPNSGQRAVARIQRSVQSMQSLVITLLWMSRNNNLDTQYESIETEALLDKIVDGQRYLLSQKQVEVETNVSCGDIYQPRELVEVVLTNLVRNAFQHGGQGNVAMLLSKEGFEISNTTPDPNMSGKGSRDTSFGIGLELVERVCHSQGWQLSHQQHQDKFTVCVQFTDSKE
ncbi:histidine kinase [Vibrio fortis]|uniref:histidine kinase n=1 Tax=Vibrio fortis TaxID=212667 RepID=A0A066UIQ2_9VIBR|nr:HAMP domain-containing sensor histidine kinase [Vibrio fortis]KDN26955.1 histidine kinase [Vibrio fortis]